MAIIVVIFLSFCRSPCLSVYLCVCVAGCLVAPGLVGGARFVWGPALWCAVCADAIPVGLVEMQREKVLLRAHFCKPAVFHSGGLAHAQMQQIHVFPPAGGCTLGGLAKGGEGQQSCENPWPSSCLAPMARLQAQGPSAIFAVFACGRLVCLPACRPFWQFCCGTQFLIFMALSFCLGPMAKKKFLALRAQKERREKKRRGG